MFSMSNMIGREEKKAQCYFTVETTYYKFTGMEC